MLGDMQAVNAGGFDKLQPFVEQLRQRTVAMLDMIK